MPSPALNPLPSQAPLNPKTIKTSRIDKYWPQGIMALCEVILCSGFPTQLMLAFIFALLGFTSTNQTGQLSLTYIATLSLIDTAVLLSLICYCLHLHGEMPRKVFLGNRPSFTEIALGLLLTPLIFIAAITSLSMIKAFWPWLRNVPENPLEALLQSPREVLIFIIVAVIAGAFREEIQRAFVLRRFEQHLGGGWFGLIVFSVVFGLGHSIQGWDASIVTALLGAIWGALYLIRRNVLPAIVSHAGFNIIEILIAVSASTAS
jgi:membrane protease YdiL (CAAX protease family)